MPYIIGTAGHIDHGKTSLIKALTGEDTDRLKEEKERGISIDLGFAHLDLGDGNLAGIVDVPGHERFIKNMLAGAHGIDVVLFTVAADDGVMPQTEEHLDIVHLLGITSAIFVITKADLASQARIAEVEEEIKILTLGTTLEDSPVIAVSSATGQGLAELKELISGALRALDKPAPGGYFRLPVDRAFVLQGHGVVVTGTARAGEIRVGERVRCLPGDAVFRVRSLQVHGQAVDVAGWGRRVALNLSGADTAGIARGQVICHEKISLTSTRFDAYLEVRPAARKGIKNHQGVRVHLGTAERLGKIIILGGDTIEPKKSGYVQVTVAEPLSALRGDHFIVRDQTAQRTLAGGMVIHPWAKRHRRGDDLGGELEGLHHGDVPELTRIFLDGSETFALPIDSIHQFLNCREEDIRAAIEKMPAIRGVNAEGERVYTTENKWRKIKEQVSEILRDFHAGHPLVPGMDMEGLRGKLAYELAPKIFRVIVDTLIAERLVAKEENLLRLAGHRVQLGGQDKSLMERIKKILGEQELAPPDLKQIEKEVAVPRAKLAEVLRLLEREGAIVKVASDLYFLSRCVDRVRDSLRRHLLEKGEISAAAFRDLLGSSRKYTIALLEYFDREGLTLRIGDIRRLKSGAGAEKRGPAH